MNRSILPVPSFLLALALTTSAASQTPACPTGNPRNINYMRRDNDKRCEGMIARNISQNDFGLRSFAIGQIPNANAENFSLTIPKLAKLPKEPILRIQSTEDRYYQLDPLGLKADRNQWRFQWPSTVLNDEGIRPSQLRSLARAEVGNESIILPVRFSTSSNYDIRIYTGSYTQTITLKILDTKGTMVYTQTKQGQSGTEVAFTWNGRTTQNKLALAGRYSLSINATVERPNSPPALRQTKPQFEHDPKWLR